MIKNQFRHFLGKDLRTQIFIVFVILLIIGIALDFAPEKAEHPLESKEVEMATMIPKGMVLQPLSLKNSESLSLVLDKYGTVSLYEPGKDRPFVRNLKVFRAPRDPSIFLAMVPMKHSTEFVKRNQDLTAVVLKQDRENSGTIFDYRTPKRKRSLLIGNTER